MDPMSDVAATPNDERPHAVPLTEAILAALPGPRLAWFVLWPLVAPLRPTLLFLILGLEFTTQRHATLPELYGVQAVFAYVVLVALVGTAMLVNGVRRLPPVLERLGIDPDVTPVFRGLTSRLGPTILTLIVVAVATPSTYAGYGPVAALVDLPLLAIVALPIMTFVWTYLTILAGVGRLGGATLTLEAFPQDRSLGVGPIGSLTFTGLWLVFASAIPALLASGRDVTTFALVVVIVLVTVGLFVLSLARLHLQMAAAKRRYVELTRGLVAAAYAPVAADAALPTLQERAPTLGAAQALADRAERILEWPVDERAVAFIGVVVTGVLTSLVVRLVFAAAGL
jgi:hypothetical protein